MTCNHCDGTVWFDHAKKQWRHAPGESCSRPLPRAIKRTARPKP